MSRQDNPGVILPPPLIYGIGLVVGLVLNAILPLAELPAWIRAIGLICIVLSFIPGPWALIVMLRAGTHPEPSHPTTALVTDGPFRFTRNPIYLTFTLFLAGLALLTSNLWMLAACAVVVAVMHPGVIFREERYLEAKFGEAYRAYRQRVRRWL